MAIVDRVQVNRVQSLPCLTTGLILSMRLMLNIRIGDVRDAPPSGLCNGIDLWRFQNQLWAPFQADAEPWQFGVQATCHLQAFVFFGRLLKSRMSAVRFTPYERRWRKFPFAA